MLSTPEQLKRRKMVRRWAIAITVFILIIALAWFNQPWIWDLYIDAKYNNFKTGDKLYGREQSMRVSDYHYRLYTWVRPLKEDDVDAMDIELWKKALIKQDLHPNAERFLIESGWRISTDSLNKYKTACIGTYLGADIGKLHVRPNDDGFLLNFIKISPNKMALVKTDENLYKIDDDIPSGYTLDDENDLYIMGFEVYENQELKHFRDVK